jgi:hypothetical protein
VAFEPHGTQNSEEERLPVAAEMREFTLLLRNWEGNKKLLLSAVLVLLCVTADSNRMKQTQSVTKIIIRNDAPTYEDRSEPTVPTKFKEQHLLVEQTRSAYCHADCPVTERGSSIRYSRLGDQP